ncbi:hypothetical protein P691DRAFT_806217 [Macrolepiota fuliginosa MF-IS2]|uniref:Uncharacterized protein n=1 Tax=Macrolepiota fuliginosa MF-IS2 TaxID=1400762 RepID=A0A9P6BVD3_9AGAR|nr:hypothetical protein P691DRAFT_806217 [Macrolepiota fuliginosa MF-IS2]
MDSYNHITQATSTPAQSVPLPPAKYLCEDARRPPKRTDRLSLSFWCLQFWFECTFGLTVMEPWAWMVALTLFAIVSSLVCTGLVHYFSQQLAGLQQGMMYYPWGHADELPIFYLS